MIVQIDVVGPIDPPEVLHHYPERIQVMLCSYTGEESDWYDHRNVARWLLHVDGRVFSNCEGDHDAD